MASLELVMGRPRSWASTLHFWLQSLYFSTLGEQSPVALEEASTHLNCYLFIFMNREFIHRVPNSKGTKGYIVKLPLAPVSGHPGFLPGAKHRL